MRLDLNSLKKAIDVLQRSIKVAQIELKSSEKDLRETIRAGVIQNFEVAYEQSWKIMKRWLEQNIGNTYVDGVTRRELFRLAAENHLVSDVNKWMEYHHSRNLTTHTYDEDIAEEVFQTAYNFYSDAQRLIKELEFRND
jgi:nucleotidyltransferase substrate binding protein (TIGR01987 family)